MFVWGGAKRERERESVNEFKIPNLNFFSKFVQSFFRQISKIAILRLKKSSLTTKIRDIDLAKIWHWSKDSKLGFRTVDFCTHSELTRQIQEANFRIGSRFSFRLGLSEGPKILRKSDLEQRFFKDLPKFEHRILKTCKSESFIRIWEKIQKVDLNEFFFGKWQKM